MTKKSIVLFGGSFDPIHNAHIEIANDILTELNLAAVHMLPCNIGVHKNVNATSKQRIKMLKAATADYRNIKIDLREINRQGKSYMIDTINEIKTEDQATTILLIIGSDSLNNLHTWKNWSQILELTNIIVAPRKGSEIKPHEKISDKITNCKQDLIKSKHGTIYILQKKYANISSSYIRKKISTNTNVTDLIEHNVYDIIKSECLYNSAD